MTHNDDRQPDDLIDEIELAPTQPVPSEGLTTAIASGADVSGAAANEERNEERLDEATEDEANPV
jgi:hypothetical protein